MYLSGKVATVSLATSLSGEKGEARHRQCWSDIQSCSSRKIWQCCISSRGKGRDC